jgi:hypothetical protein
MVDTVGAVTEVDIMGATTVDSLAVIEGAPFTVEDQDSEADSLRVTGRMVITIPIHTTGCAKDGFQLATITWKADKTRIPAFGMRFRYPKGIGKLFLANSSSSFIVKPGNGRDLVTRFCKNIKILPKNMPCTLKTTFYYPIMSSSKGRLKFP